MSSPLTKILIIIIIIIIIYTYLTSQMLEMDFLTAMLHYLLNQLVDHSDYWETVTY